MDPDIVAHYERGDERDRLVTHPIERLRTCAILERHLPPAPARVLDVGGGPGTYSSWLADAGYDVRLVDPVSLHVEQATTLAAGRFEAVLGDARALDAGDASYDVVLLLGPLYHLVDGADRARALAEAARVVVPGGLVAAAAINQFAGVLDAVVKEYLDGAGIRAYGAQLATTNQQSQADAPGFTTAYFHRAAELRDELDAAGLVDVTVVGVEGLASWLTDEADRAADPARLERIMAAADVVEAEPELIGLSAHLLATGRRP